MAKKKDGLWAPSESAIRKVAVEAVTDSLRIVGFGMVEFDGEGWNSIVDYLAQSVSKWHGTLSDTEYAALKVASRDIPSLASLSGWTKIDCLAVALRIRAGNESIRNDLWDNPLLRFAVAASARSQLERHGLLRGPSEMISLVSTLASRDGAGLCWQKGILKSDVLDAYARNLTSAQTIAEDISQLCRPILEGVTAEPQAWRAGQGIQAAMRTALQAAVKERVALRVEECRAALLDLQASSSVDHQWVSDLGLDSRLLELGMNTTYGILLALGKTGMVCISPAFDVRLKDLEAERIEQSKKESANATSETAVFLGGESLNALDSKEDLIAWTKATFGMCTVVGARARFAWRGSVASARAADQHVSRTLRTVALTAWLVVSGEEETLGYLGDPSFDSTPWWEADSLTGPTLQRHRDRQQAIAIEEQPESFPIADFMRRCVDGICRQPSESAAWTSILSGIRLLGECDSLLSRFPNQAFASAMAAVEACLATKGADLSKTVARRGSRLLVDKLPLRTRCENLLSDLYSHRSKIVHGEQCTTSVHEAVFMRYVASCVVFGCAGLLRALGRLDSPTGIRVVHKHLDQDNFGSELLPGVVRCEHLLNLLDRGYEFRPME